MTCKEFRPGVCIDCGRPQADHPLKAVGYWAPGVIDYREDEEEE